ncbi:hypothetical protein R3P38DRAFT_2585172 [Favolaschia claudopus]|uniref:Uncharacterized protein n=1 Tax=Favolaschia claudopus TaxID=2862362 RepID=A0AAV9Z711_9AGAR
MPSSSCLQGDGEGGWDKVVALWWKLEEAANFTGPAKGMGTKDRPTVVKGWINRARVGGPQPAIKDSFGFDVSWWKYWAGMNPAWRIEGKKKGEGEGDWDTLRKQTGKNGLLNVLICLRWWRDAFEIRNAAEWGERVASDWKDAVADVLWVMERLT